MNIKVVQLNHIISNWEKSGQGDGTIDNVDDGDNNKFGASKTVLTMHFFYVKVLLIITICTSFIWGTC